MQQYNFNLNYIFSNIIFILLILIYIYPFAYDIIYYLGYKYVFLVIINFIGLYFIINKINISIKIDCFYNQ